MTRCPSLCVLVDVLDGNIVLVILFWTIVSDCNDPTGGNASRFG